MEDIYFDMNSFANHLTKARAFADHFKYKCSCPGCNNPAIKSHLFQRHPLLKDICDEKGCVLQFEDNWEDARSGRWDLYKERKRGLQDAMQFPLFCKEHDNDLFQDLEARKSIPSSKYDNLLLSFRAACAVQYEEIHRLHLHEKRAEQMQGEVYKEALSISEAFVCRMNAVIENLWRALQGKDGTYFFRMFKIPYISIAASDCIVAESDFRQHIMEDDYSEPLACMFIHLIPSQGELFLVLGCDSRYDKNGEYRKIIEGFPLNMPMDVYRETIWGILLHCHNWCCSSSLAEDAKWRGFLDHYEELKINLRDL